MMMDLYHHTSQDIYSYIIWCVHCNLWARRTRKRYYLYLSILNAFCDSPKIKKYLKVLERCMLRMLFWCFYQRIKFFIVWLQIRLLAGAVTSAISVLCVSLTGLPYCPLMKQIMMIVHFRKKLIQNGSSLEANFGSPILRMVAQFRRLSTSFRLLKLFSTCSDGSTTGALASLQRWSKSI